MIENVVRIIALFPDPLLLAGLFLVASFLVKRLAFRRRPIAGFVCQAVAFAGFTATLVVSGAVPSDPTPAMDPSFRFLAISLFKIVWWLAGAWLLIGFFRAVVFFERQPTETRFIQDLFAGVAYTGAVFAIIANVFNMPISGLLAASGVIAIVVGLALQSTLGDVFSGVVLNVAKPYRTGDWILLDGGTQGRVIETNWRATQILTPTNDLTIVPNSMIARTKITNASNPTKTHSVIIVVRLEPTVAPSHSCAVLETALLSCNKILQTPAPFVTIRALDAVALECELQFSVSTIDQSTEAQNELFDLVYRHCGAAGIRLAPPPGSSFTQPPHALRQEPTDAPRRLLNHLSIFAALSDDERTALAPKVKRRTYKAGDILIEPDTEFRGLFILTSGALVALEKDGSGDREVVRLSPGDCFGEDGILTDTRAKLKVKALTKVVVYEIAKDDLAPILKERPAVAAELGQILARRQASAKERLAHQIINDEHAEGLGARVAGRIRDLFGIE